MSGYIKCFLQGCRRSIRSHHRNHYKYWHPAIAVCLAVVTAATTAAEPTDRKHSPAFMRTQALYELCTSKYQADEAHCEGYIVGLADMMQNDQLTTVKACLPAGTTSQEVMGRVVSVLNRQKNAIDMRAGAVTQIGPLLAMLYNCTPGVMPVVPALKP